MSTPAPSPDNSRRRAVVFSPRAALAREQACRDHPRLEQLFKGLVWLLERNPNVGGRNTIQRVGAPPQVFWLYRTKQKDPDLPAILFVYDVDDAQVYIRSFRIEFQRVAL